MCVHTGLGLRISLHPKRLARIIYTLRVQLVRNPPAMQEIWVPSLGWEDLLEKGKAAHSSILAWRIPCAVHPWGRKESDTTERRARFTCAFDEAESAKPTCKSRVCCMLVGRPWLN